MKTKIYLTITLLFAVANSSFGQLKVNSDGHVGISSSTFSSLLNVGGLASAHFSAAFAPASDRYGAVYIYNKVQQDDAIGLYVSNQFKDGYTFRSKYNFKRANIS